MEDTRQNTVKKLDRRQFFKGSVAGGTALSLGLGVTGSALAASPASQGQCFGSESLPTGRQYQISRGHMAAIVTEEGATLRSLTVKGQEFLVTFPEDQPTTFYHGQVLVPWANRVAGGVYQWNGTSQQLPINDVSHNAALHGLAHWLNWTVEKQTQDSITLTVVQHSQDGYPFVLKYWETYALTDRGLEVSTTALNIGSNAAPYTVGHHPYFTLGTDLINSNILRIPANSYFQTDSDLIAILPAVSVAGTPYDFRTPREIGTTVMDTNFADVVFDSDGYARTILTTASGHPRLTVFMDHHHHYMQFYTSDTVPIVSQIRKAIVIEAYTAACNAYNNGLGLIVLQPNEQITTHWGATIEL